MKTFYQRWSWPLLLLTLCAVPVALYSAAQAIRSNENHVEDWLPKSFDETRKLSWFRKHFASDQFVIVSWDGCRLGMDEGQQDDPRLTKLTQMLAPISEGDSTDVDLQSSWSDGTEYLESLDGPEASPDVRSTKKPVLPTLELSSNDQELAKKYFKSVETGRTVLNKLMSEPLSLSQREAARRLKGVMIGPDGRQTCMILTLKPEALRELKSVVGNGRKRIFGANIPPGLLPRLLAAVGVAADQVHMGGPPVDNSAIDEEGERTLIRLAGVSGLLGIGLAWWSLRSITLTAIVFLCGVMSSAISLGIVWVTGQNVDAILMSMPSLVYVLAISGAIHLVSYYREAVETKGLHGAAERAVRAAWKPALLCSITTAIGLLSLAVSELLPIKKFGIYSAIGVMTLMFVVYAVMPAALHVTSVGKRWIGKRRITGNPTHAPTEESRWFWIANFTIRHYRIVGFLSIAITAAIGVGLFHAKSSIDLLKLFDSRAKILQDYHWLEANLGKLVPLEIVLVFPEHWQKEVTQADEVGAANSVVSPLSLVQRMEVVARLQSIIEKRFGIRGGEIVGQSLSATAFVPKLPNEKTGARAIAYRTALSKRLVKDKQSLIDTGFLRIDEEDGSELWRVSLRVAAFNDVDYGTFTRDLHAVSQPLIDACYLRSRILNEFELLPKNETGDRRKVLLWSFAQTGTVNGSSNQSHIDQMMPLLSEQLRELAIEVAHQNSSPTETPIAAIPKLGNYDAVLACGDFSEADLQLARSAVPRLITVKSNELSHTQRQAQPAKTGNASSKAVELSAVYTGVVPIVYQAQRALLNSLAESTFWSFLTITPIMMLVSRSFFAGCVAMIPNLVPIILIFGGMGWLGVAIDIGSLMTASIALGVAVDDTIHFLARFREELDHHPDRESAIAAAYCHCAVPTLQAATISGLGLSVFAFSTFAPTQRFGWLMLCILFAGVVSELVLLPALLASPLGKCFVKHPKIVNDDSQNSQHCTKPVAIETLVERKAC